MTGPSGMAAPRVRWAWPSDRDELVRMRLALWPDSTAQEVDDLLEGHGPPAYFVLVAERVGEKAGLAGFAEVGERPYAEGCATSPVAYLEGIWVDPDHRRSGVGAALVEAAVAWARGRGLREMGSDADLDNVVSHDFHRGSGFHEVGRAVCFRRSLDDPEG